MELNYERKTATKTKKCWMIWMKLRFKFGPDQNIHFSFYSIISKGENKNNLAWREILCLGKKVKTAMKKNDNLKQEYCRVLSTRKPCFPKSALTIFHNSRWYLIAQYHWIVTTEASEHEQYVCCCRCRGWSQFKLLNTHMFYAHWSQRSMTVYDMINVGGKKKERNKFWFKSVFLVFGLIL